MHTLIQFRLENKGDKMVKDKIINRKMPQIYLRHSAFFPETDDLSNV